MATRKKKAQEEKPDGEKLLEDLKAGDHVLLREHSRGAWRDAKVTKMGIDYIHVEWWPGGRSRKYDRSSGRGEFGSAITTPAFLALEEQREECATLLRQHGFNVEYRADLAAVLALAEVLLSLIAEGKVKDRRPKPPSAPDLPEDA